LFLVIVLAAIIIIYSYSYGTESSTSFRFSITGEDFVAGIPLALLQLTMIVLFSLNLKHLKARAKIIPAA